MAKKKAPKVPTLATKEDWEDYISKLHGDRIKLLGQFRGLKRDYRFKCYTCLNTWKGMLPTIVEGCPFCSGRRKARKKATNKTLTIGGVEVRVQGYEGKALQWLLDNRNLTMEDIVLDSSGKVPIIDYKVRRRNRRYYPDIYVPKTNTIYEVKSSHTLGLYNGRGWKKNQEKAKATKEAGFRFVLLLMDGKGNRLYLPKGWYKMTRNAVLAKIKERDSKLSLK